jgi:Zn-dependent protease with chaperone function
MLAQGPAQRDKVLARYERWRFFHQMGQIGAFIIVLVGFGWGWAVRQWWGYDPPLGPGSLAGKEIVTLLPFLLVQVLSWLFFYDADRAAHRAAHRLIDADSFAQTWLEGRQAPPAPFHGRWSYVAFQLRQKLALVFIPVLLLIVQKELDRLIRAFHLEWPGLVYCTGLVGLAAVFVGMPLLVRIVLGLKPLPAGPLRDRLLAASRRLHFRASDILVWNTRSGMANAMVIGLLPWLRYVVFTDRLLEEFTPDEVEAVFGHEVGHVRHQHMLYYLFFLVGSMAVLSLAVDRWMKPVVDTGSQVLGWAAPVVAPASEPATLGSDMLLPVVGLLLVYIFLVFGFLSRRCERQADVFGCRAVSCGRPACLGHAPDTTLVYRGAGLCGTGIRIFIQALEKVAHVNGINRERPGFLQSWQHSTIARRVAFLDRVIDDSKVEVRFQRRLGLIKWAMMLALGLALMALLMAGGPR